MTPRHHQPRVVIAGGGVAGLETLLALRALAGRRVDITLLAPEPEFVVRATTVGEPFDRAQGRRLALAEVAAEHEAHLVAAGLASVDPVAHTVTTTAGTLLSYDVLVVATGARAVEALPGAVTFRGRTDVDELRVLLDEVLAGQSHSVVFALPRTMAWSLPLYELALMTSALVVGAQVPDVELTVVTPESEPLELFGPAAGRALRSLLTERGIDLLTRSRPERIGPGGLVLEGGATLRADRVVSVPVLEGRPIAGLPATRRNFLPVDRHGRVRGLTDVYAAGDGADFPIKQGGLGAQQADAVAQAIAHRAGAAVTPEPFRPVIRGLLMTGAEPLYLRAEPGDPTTSAASDRPLWWPPAKIAGRYLASYLASARPSRLEAATLTDRPAPPPVRPATVRGDALELALVLADADAKWGDHASALRALEAAESLEGALPPEYERKREAWRTALAAH